MRKNCSSVFPVLNNSFRITLIAIFLLGFASAAPVTKVPRSSSAGKVLLSASDENLPLITARNSLSNLFADQRPELQPGFANAVDVWLLYAPEFDRLSGNLQAYLLQKYGLDTPRASLSDDERK